MPSTVVILEFPEGPEVGLFVFGIRESFARRLNAWCTFRYVQPPRFNLNLNKKNLEGIVRRASEAMREYDATGQCLYVASGVLSLAMGCNIPFSLTSVFQDGRMTGMKLEPMGNCPKTFAQDFACIGLGIENVRPITGASKSEQAEADLVIDIVVEGLNIGFELLEKFTEPSAPRKYHA
jgi:hypothetical protein